MQVPRLVESVTGKFEGRDSVIAKSHEYDLLPENQSKKNSDFSTCAIEYVEDGEGNVVAVQDPIEVSIKGARNIDVNQPVSRNGWPLSFDEIKIQCGKYKEQGHNKRNKKYRLYKYVLLCVVLIVFINLLIH
jgi:hypothetical protein